MMRTRWSYYVKERLKEEDGKFGRVLEALNLLGNTAW